MGFRGTFCTTDYPIQWPDWFREKYADTVHVPERGGLASKRECKLYGTWSELLGDIHKSIVWDQWDSKETRPEWAFHFVVLCLFECGGVSRFEITRAGVRCSEPDGWAETEGCTHSYCYGCSDLPAVAEELPQRGGNNGGDNRGAGETGGAVGG